MLKHTEIKKGKMIELNHDPYEVLEHSHKVKARGRSVMQTKLRNMRTGTTLKRNFHPSEEIEEADIDKMNAVFIYSRRGEYIFHEEGDSSKRFKLSKDQLGEKGDYLTQGATITALLFQEKIIGISLPAKVTLKIKEAPPGIRGNTAEGGTKTATLETNKEIEVPLFVEEGETIEINTETGKYVRRVN